MCGIVGKYDLNNLQVNKKDIDKMLATIVHRGPDYGASWVCNNVGLGHRLLKIQDLSSNSVQPYIFNDLVMVYNGEIYNYEELREELKFNGYTFASVGDTEVLIKLFDCFGIEETLNKIEGSFAISLYNIKEKKMYLIRDRFGIKPLHYYKDETQIVFASEIKAILTNENIKRKFNMQNVFVSLACRLWMHPEWTMFENIYNVKPGKYLEIYDNIVKEKTYYRLKYNLNETDIETIEEKFDKNFKDSIIKKLKSQVPVAAFLSGGIDSSLLCKVAQDNLHESLNTYTICYNEDNDLDLNHAHEIAIKERFIQHDVLIPQKFYTIENIDKVTRTVEEVLIDKVYIPVYFNYQAAKKAGFTVVLNGQGSDESWLGYIFNYDIYNYINEDDDKEKLLNNYYLPNIIFDGKIKHKHRKKIIKALNTYLEDTLEIYRNKANDDKLNDYSIMSIRTILHDLLLQEDKLAMAHSVESRVPFVDSHKLVELALSIPRKY